MDDLTIIYYTANRISNYFLASTGKQLLAAADGIPIISVSQEPLELGENICVGNIGVHTFNIYKQFLIGAKAAKTKYIAAAEDDVLYSHEHFHTRLPAPGTFLYDMNRWTIFTWSKPPIFSYKPDRVVLHQLICERDLFIEAMEERFSKYPDQSMRKVFRFGEPGKHRDEKSLGVKLRVAKRFWSKKPSIVFCHREALQYVQFGKRKAPGPERKKHLPGWGAAVDIAKLYRRADA